jgi:hypothetical protein
VYADYFQKEESEEDGNEGLLLFAVLVTEVHDDVLQERT